MKKLVVFGFALLASCHPSKRNSDEPASVKSQPTTDDSDAAKVMLGLDKALLDDELKKAGQAHTAFSMQFGSTVAYRFLPRPEQTEASNSTNRWEHLPSGFISVFSDDNKWANYFDRFKATVGLGSDSVIDATGLSSRVPSFLDFGKKRNQLPFAYSDLKVVLIDSSTFASQNLANDIWNMTGSGVVQTVSRNDDTTSSVYVGNVVFIFKTPTSNSDSTLKILLGNFSDTSHGFSLPLMQLRLGAQIINFDAR